MMMTQTITQSPSFLYKRGPIYYFRRHVPQDLQQHYKTKIICTSLRTRSASLAQRGAAVMANKLDAEWMTLRLNSFIPTSANNMPSRLSYTFTDALDLYLRLKSAGKPSTFERGARRNVDYLSEAVEEKGLDQYTSIDAGRFRDYLLDKGMSSSSVRRVFSSIRAIFNLAASEYGIQHPNPFAGLYIPDLKDSKKRKPVSSESIRIMQGKCRQIDDDLRWILALVSDSGMRLSEAVGLYWSDVYLSDSVPHVILQPNSHRRLKTESSARTIPLVGMSLWALQRAAKTRTGEHVFPRYMKKGTCNANSASAAINKWVKAELKEDVTIHSLRHSMRDRLRAVQCPTEIIDQHCGWSSGSVGASYGEGYPLSVLQSWLMKVI